MSITTDLIAAGVPNPRPHKSKTGRFTIRHVLYVLRNSAYTGRRTFTGPNGETAIVTFPPLVTAAEFAEVQAHVQSRTRHQPKRTRHPALFAGHTRCAECGGTLSVFSNRNVSKAGAVTEYAYYRCRGASNSSSHFIRQGGRLCPSRKMHPITDIDPAGWTMFCEAMTSPAVLAAAVQRTQPDAPDHTPRIAELKAQMAQIVQRAVTHNLPDDVLTAALQPLREELATLERDMAVVPVDTPDMTALAEAMRAYLPNVTDLEQRRAALDTWKVRLHIGPEGARKIELTVHRG